MEVAALQFLNRASPSGRRPQISALAGSQGGTPCLSTSYAARDSEGNNVQVTLGYDRPLNCIFCTITAHDGEIVYSNLSDPNAGTRQQDVNYYRPILVAAGV